MSNNLDESTQCIFMCGSEEEAFELLELVCRRDIWATDEWYYGDTICAINSEDCEKELKNLRLEKFRVMARNLLRASVRR